MDKFDIDVFKNFLHSSTIGRKFVYTDITGSTMDDARRLALDVKEYPHGTVVMSERQTKARGANDHKWDATNTGNIYVSLVLHMSPVYKTFEDSFDLEAAACLAVLQVVKNYGVTKVVPKWPNDLWVRGHKLAGFLVEDGHFDIPGTEKCLFILGMGINVNADVRRSTVLQRIATSMVCERAGQYVNREKFLADVCASLEQALASKMEDIYRTFIKENLFQENCELSASNEKTGKVLDGKLVSFSRNWDVTILDSHTGEVVRGTSDEYSIRPKVLNKITIVFSGTHKTSANDRLSQWLTAVVDTSKYVVCLIPESTITETEEWMKKCSLLVLADDVSKPDIVTSKLSLYLQAGGNIMAFGKGAVYLAKVLHIHLKEVVLDSSADPTAVLISLQTETILCLPPTENNVRIPLHVNDTEYTTNSGDQPDMIKPVPLCNQPQSATFLADPIFHYYETETAFCCPSHGINDGLCLLDQPVTQSSNSDTFSSSTKANIRAYFYDVDSQQRVLTVFTGNVKCGGHVALWGLDIVNVPDPRVISAQDMRTLEEDRFKRDQFLQQVVEVLLTT